MRIITTILSLLLLSGCYDTPIKNNTPPAKSITITSDTTLTESSRNIQYIITKDNATLDLGTKTIHVNGDYQAVLVRANNVTIKNGAIRGKGFAKGVQIVSCIKPTDITPLNNDSSYESVIYNRCFKNLKVEGVHFESLKTGIYVSDYIKGSVIHNNIFKNIDRMGIYLSPAVTSSVISNNSFLNNGHRYVESYGRPRGSISIDSAYGNTIKDNYFNTSPKWVRRPFASDYRVPEIELYRNCGEPTFNGTPFPRIHGADNNNILNNTFENVGLVAWFKYRSHHQLSSCVGNYPDKSDNNTITGSTLINIEQFVIDEGVNNIW